MPYSDKSKQRIHHAWQNIRERCFNPSNKNYQWYGARGISICEEWKHFKAFYEWAIKNGYSDELTIDRIDSDGNYEPMNCRWVSTKDQSRNKRNNHYLECNGRRMVITDWAKEIGISAQALHERIYIGGWNVEEALSTPPLKRRRVKD